MSYEPNSNIDTTRNVLYVEETAYGVTPTNPTFLNAGIANTIAWKKSPQHQSVDILGTIDSYGEYKFGNDYTVDLKYYLTDTLLLKYGTELPGGTGTIEKSLTLFISKKVNNIENFRLIQGCITESCTLDFSKIPLVSQTFRASNITKWMTLSELTTLIGGTPVYPAALSVDPWTSLGAGSVQPLTINAVPYDIEKFTFTVARSILIQQPIGNPNPLRIKAGKRKVTAAFTTWEKDNILELQVETFTAVPMVLTIQTGKTATFAGLRNVAVAGGEDASATKFDTFDYTMMAKSITVN